MSFDLMIYRLLRLFNYYRFWIDTGYYTVSSPDGGRIYYTDHPFIGVSRHIVANIPKSALSPDQVLNAVDMYPHKIELKQNEETEIE